MYVFYMEQTVPDTYVLLCVDAGFSICIFRNLKLSMYGIIYLRTSSTRLDRQTVVQTYSRAGDDTACT